MIYLVGNGSNGMKTNFIYGYPKSKMSKKQFLAEGEQVSVINIASGNTYNTNPQQVEEGQMFSSFASALTSADQEVSEMNINVNIQNYINGDINDAQVREIFDHSTTQKVKEVVAEVKKPMVEVVTALKLEIGQYQENLQQMQEKVSELEQEGRKAVAEFKSNLPTVSYKSSKTEWTAEDFAEITKLSQALENIS